MSVIVALFPFYLVTPHPLRRAPISRSSSGETNCPSYFSFLLSHVHIHSKRARDLDRIHITRTQGERIGSLSRENPTANGSSLKTKERRTYNSRRDTLRSSISTNEHQVRICKFHPMFSSERQLKSTNTSNPFPFYFPNASITPLLPFLPFGIPASSSSVFPLPPPIFSSKEPLDSPTIIVATRGIRALQDTQSFSQIPPIGIHGKCPTGPFALGAIFGVAASFDFVVVPFLV